MACKRDLVLLEDTVWTQRFSRLRVSQPKTRLRGARHQAAKVGAARSCRRDCPALFEVAQGFPSLARLESKLRRRLDVALSRLRVSSSRGPSKPLDLGLAPLGAPTYVEEDGICQRHGDISSRNYSFDILV